MLVTSDKRQQPGPAQSSIHLTPNTMPLTLARQPNETAFPFSHHSTHQSTYRRFSRNSTKRTFAAQRL
jgi:hypothetical protein